RAARGRRGRRAAARDAARIGRVAAGVDLGTIEEAVLVAFDAGPRAVAWRHAGVGQLLPRGRRERADLGVRQESLARPVAAELAGYEPHGAALLAGDGALHAQLTLAGCGALDEKIDAGIDGGRVGAGERRLLSHDRRQVGVELE